MSIKRESEMFKHYPQPDNYTPYNIPHGIKHEEITIMAGESATHSFEIPFNVIEDVTDFEIIYKLGISMSLIKSYLGEKEKEYPAITVVYDEDSHKSMITCVLSVIETQLFRDTLLDCKVQIKFIMKDLSIAYTEVYSFPFILQIY